MFFQPRFGFAEVWAGGFDAAPEAGGVVHFVEVHQLVDDDVVAHEGRGLDEAPVERDRGASGAGAPARALVADGHAGDAELMRGSEFEDAREEFARGEAAASAS